MEKEPFYTNNEKFNVGICHPGAIDKTTGLIKNALFTVTINGSTIMDNFMNQSPVLTLGRTMPNNLLSFILSFTS